MPFLPRNAFLSKPQLNLEHFLGLDVLPRLNNLRYTVRIMDKLSKADHCQ